MNEVWIENIELKYLEAYNPFSHVVWRGLHTPVTKQEIAEAIENNSFRETPILSSNLLDEIELMNGSWREDHIKRIAYLVIHNWNDAIEIDVGVPSLGCHVNWIVQDGNHRLAAAFYREDTHIKASIGGQINYAKEILGLNHD